MRLLEALEIIKTAPQLGEPQLRAFLACGFEPLHLATFLRAHLQRRFPERSTELRTGLYGSHAENLKKAAEYQPAATFVVWEWADLDPRLSIRGSGRWKSADLTDILDAAKRSAQRFVDGVSGIADATSVVLARPTAHLAPVSHFPSSQVSPFSAELEAIVWSTLAQLSALPSVRIAKTHTGTSFDPKSELKTGFPYTLEYADSLAAKMVALAFRPDAKKGLITDLDDTLWKGIVGEVGANNVHWDLDHGAMVHGTYQRVLSSLAESGILLAVASKNEESVARQVLERGDISIEADAFFPMEIHWGSKAESVSRILDAWNVGADSVVFLDDSPMELATVAAAHPTVECMLFPKNDPAAAMELFRLLRDRFGKVEISETDRLRLKSIRASAAAGISGSSKETDLDTLKAAKGNITITSGRNPADPRALELINKTNQFNLNGRRVSDAEWHAFRSDPASFAAVVSYEDVYGPLGKIAVLCGRSDGESLSVSSWVMSCRAFSRRIEHHLLQWAFDRFDIQEILLDYAPTERNWPLQEFLRGVAAGEALNRISREGFLQQSWPLIHQLEDQFDA